MDFGETVFYIAELIGVIAFAASGAMIAIDRGLDLFGVIFLSIMTSFGGGVTRDLLLGITPPKMFYSFDYIICVIITAVIIIAIAAIFKKKFFVNRKAIDRFINFFDALGLGIFAIMGVQACFRKGYSDNIFMCLFLGMTTGVGGGILRDLLSHAKPLVLVKQIYALAALLGAGSYYYLTKVKLNSNIAMIISVILVVVIRILAAHYRWDLPKIEKFEDEDTE